VKKVLIFIMAVLATAELICEESNTQEIVFKGKPITINVEVGKITEVVLPKDIASIAKGVASEVLQIEVLGERLYLLPLQSITADIYIITTDGTSYPINLVVGKGEWYTRVNIAKPGIKDIQKKGPNFTIELIRMLLLGIEPPGSTRLDGNVEVFNNGYMKLTLKTIYELPNCNSYILTAENLHNKSIVFPMQDIEFPNLLVISVDRQVLGPKGEENSKTKIYMAVGK